MITRKMFLVSAALLALMPAACAPMMNGQSKAVDLTFAQLQPAQINVSAIKIINNTPTSKNPHVLPGIALENYAKRRLEATGSEGLLNFIVQQATLVAAEQPLAGDWTDSFQVANPIEYTITMRVGLDLKGRAQAPDMRSSYMLERKKILAGGTSLVDRDNALNALLSDMVRDMDSAVTRGLSDNLKILVSAGPAQFGKAQAPQHVVVQPGPANAAPVSITGAAN